MKHPHQFTTRILLAVSGLSPQILTETLYGLTVTTNTPFIPTEIHLITTIEGAHRAKLDLLHQDTGKFLAFCEEYQMPDIQFNESNIHIITDQAGQYLDDIRNPEQNEAAADFITRMVSKLTQNTDAAIHVSIAGGRKTMGYYLGYALSLFGRTQDRLSHVLVSDGYEGHPDFYYPSKKSRVIYTRDNRPLDTQAAKIALAEIPFVRLRNDIPENLLRGTAGFLETITLARKAELPPELIIDVATKKLSANGIVYTLPDILLAFYCWVIKQTLTKQCILYKPNDMEANPDYARQFIKEYRMIAGEMRDTDKTQQGLKSGMDSNFFAEKITRINNKLESVLGKKLATLYKIQSSGLRGSLQYATGLTDVHIHFKPIHQQEIK
ncbi:MAG: CRISPR-associated ring nuclease Csm6 [Methylococcaceae bacterium]